MESDNIAVKVVGPSKGVAGIMQGCTFICRQGCIGICMCKIVCE